MDCGCGRKLEFHPVCLPIPGSVRAVSSAAAAYCGTNFPLLLLGNRYAWRVCTGEKVKVNKLCFGCCGNKMDTYNIEFGS